MSLPDGYKLTVFGNLKPFHIVEKHFAFPRKESKTETQILLNVYGNWYVQVSNPFLI